ncbi:cytochrome P450 [Geopyxis carbonaria]|nr:cytochrome P450 [Geopyxis carbonaria]
MYLLNICFVNITDLSKSFLYTTALAIYNLVFHPFRKIPGPRLYAVSRLPWIRDWLSGKLHHTVQGMHEKYGDVVRVAPDELSFIAPDAWNDIYGIKSGKSFIRDPKWYANLTEGQDDIIVGNEVDHSRFRKAFSPPFSDKSLRENEPVINKTIDLLITRLKGQIKTKNGIADMVKWYNWTTFDVIGELVYGDSFGCLENSEFHPWLSIVLQNIKLSSYVALMERYPMIKKLVMSSLPRSLMEKRNMHVEIIREKIARRSESKSMMKDVISHISNNEDSLTQGEIEANLALITMAGSETSATSLSAASYYLTKNKGAFEKLKAEVRSTFTKEKEITHNSIKNFPYLNAVIKEALRLYPPTPVGLPRRVTVVYMTQYSAYRSPNNFHLPDEFRPERWLDDPEFASDKKEVLQPFITGPYSCIGKSLAYMEISLVLARMVWNFDWELEIPGSTTFEEEKVYALWQKSSLNLRFTQISLDKQM